MDQRNENKNCANVFDVYPVAGRLRRLSDAKPNSERPALEESFAVADDFMDKNAAKSGLQHVKSLENAQSAVSITAAATTATAPRRRPAPGAFIDAVRKARAAVAAGLAESQDFTQEFVNTLRPGDEVIGNNLDEDTLGMVQFPRDAPCIRFTDVGVDRVAWQQLKNMQTVHCEIHGIGRQVALATCAWHKEEGDPACAAIRCRHTSVASQQAFDGLDDAGKAAYFTAEDAAVKIVYSDSGLEQIAATHSNQAVATPTVKLSDEVLNNFTPDGKIRKGSKYKKKVKDADATQTSWLAT